MSFDWMCVWSRKAELKDATGYQIFDKDKSFAKFINLLANISYIPILVHIFWQYRHLPTR